MIQCGSLLPYICIWRAIDLPRTGIHGKRLWSSLPEHGPEKSNWDLLVVWPTRMMELGFMTQEEVDTTCAKLGTSMYRNVDVALLWFETLTDHMEDLNKMNMTWSMTDPCVLFKRENGNLKVATGINLMTILPSEEKKIYKSLWWDLQEIQYHCVEGSKEAHWSGLWVGTSCAWILCQSLHEWLGARNLGAIRDSDWEEDRALSYTSLPWNYPCQV